MFPSFSILSLDSSSISSSPPFTKAYYVWESAFLVLCLMGSPSPFAVGEKAQKWSGKDAQKLSSAPCLLASLSFSLNHFVVVFRENGKKTNNLGQVRPKEEVKSPREEN